jgi:hypothetical protein
MKSPDEILEDAHAYVRKINNGKIDPVAVTAYIEGYTNAWSIQQPVINMATVSDGCPSESTFEAFWNLYDKKVARPKCEKLWSKLTKSEKQECLQYVPLYVQAQPDKQYRKNPETFLRNKSWNDEIIIRNEHRQLTAADLAEKAARILQD